MTPDEVLATATRLADKIRLRQSDINQAVRYYKGQEGRLRFASDEFKDYFERRFAGFSDNWCQPVAQAPIERIRYGGMRLEGSTVADAATARAWDRNDGDRGLSEAILMMTIAKRSFALVSPTDHGSRLTFEHPDSAAVEYDPITRQRRAGLVFWQDDTAEYGEFHLPSSVLSLKRIKADLSRGERVAPDSTGWEFDTSRGAVERKNPLGALGLVELRNQALLDNDPISDIAGVIPMQDSINLVWAYQLNGLDYASLPGRVILNGEMPKEDILNQDGVKIGERPAELDNLIRDRVAWLQGQGIDIKEWSPGSLKEFGAVIEQAIGHVAAQTRTPSHYLLSGNASNVPATGYDLLEAGLVSKSNERIAYATPAVREINRLMAIADGDATRAAQIETGKTLWAKPQYRSESALMDGLGKMRAAGFPFQWIAEEYGLSPDEVKRVMQMIRDEQADPYLSILSNKDQAASDAEPAPVG